MFGFGKKKENENETTQQKADQEGQEEILTEDQNQEENPLKKELNSCLHELQTSKESYLRLLADFQNYKKRADTDRADSIDRAKADFLLSLIAIIDPLDKAVEESEKIKTKENTSWIEGFSLIQKLFHDFLKQQGVEPMTSYTTFDPLFHDAIMQSDSSDYESGQIITVFEKGFLYKGKVLRTAKVSVANNINVPTEN